MTREYGTRRRYPNPVSEGFEQRCRRRIQEDLGVNPDGVEVILHLRKQVMTLQVQLQQLQAELEAHKGSQKERVFLYRQEYMEAIWYEDEENE